jgi:hypothetical protein
VTHASHLALDVGSRGLQLFGAVQEGLAQARVDRAARNLGGVCAVTALADTLAYSRQDQARAEAGEARAVEAARALAAEVQALRRELAETRVRADRAEGAIAAYARRVAAARQAA